MGRGRQQLAAATWNEYGDNLLAHCEPVSDNLEHNQAIEKLTTLLTKLKKQYCRSPDSEAVIHTTDKLNGLTNKIDQEVWNKWRNRIRAKKSANTQEKHRPVIFAPAFNHLQKRASELGKSDASALLNAMGNDLIILKKEELEKLSSLLSSLSPTPLQSNVLEDFHHLLSLILTGLQQHNVADYTKLVAWSRGMTIDSNVIYKMGNIAEVEDGKDHVCEKLTHIENNQDIFYIKPPNN